MVCGFRMVTKVAYDRTDHFIIKFSVLYTFNIYCWVYLKRGIFLFHGNICRKGD
jgi:hypothetical protein